MRTPHHVPLILRRLSKIAGLSFLLALCLQGSAHAGTWTLRSDLWCPHTCEPGPHPGYMVEIAARAAKRSGNTLDYQLMPYSRALVQARNGSISGVLGITQEDEDGLLRTALIGATRACFFVNEEDSFRYTKAQDLDAIDSVGTVLNYVYTEDVTQWLQKNPSKVQVAAGIDPLRLNIKKVHNKEMRTFIENNAVFAYAQQSNADAKNIISAGCMPEIDLYIGFSAKHPRARDMVQAVNAEIEAMKKSGQLKTLLRKYGIQ